MSILDKLASSLNHRDEKPNEQLADEFAKKNDAKAIQELIENLNNKNKDIQSDCIKVLYEIGERKPKLIAAYVKDFIVLLDHKNNRLQWGAMTAIDSITNENPEIVYQSLSKILAVAESGSVITKDHAVNILIKLCAIKKFSEDAFELLIEQLKNSFPNQLAMYAENSLPIINEKNKNIFIRTLTARLKDIEKETKRKRVAKVIKKLS
ncbi:MAG TPA: hypothetical protein VKT28_14685 [Puia sp.]|nr:hypothetical protein [Puia sp.]